MTRTSPASELPQQLRQATKLPHHALDHHPVLAPLLKPDLSRVQYGNALAALHGVYQYAESWILAFLDQNPGVFDYAARRKLPALQADLHSLQRTPLPLAWDFQAPKTLGALIGILYPLEGSTLGGQYIARHLSQLPGPRLPTRFFTGYGELTPQRWDEFIRFVDTQSSPGDYADATATACSLFGAIRTHLDGVSQVVGVQRDADGPTRR
jgi:heme oxygenase